MKIWPWNESREAAARRIAISYRRLLELTLQGRISDPQAELSALDTRWKSLAQHWITPFEDDLLSRLDDWLTPAELVELLPIKPHDLRNWERDGRIRSVSVTRRLKRYRVGDVVTCSSKRQQRRSSSMLQLSPPCPKTEVKP